MRPQYIIEHMEEDDPDAPSTFPQWALLEYRHMLTLVGEGSDELGPSTVHFTSLSKASIQDLEKELNKTAKEKQAEYKLHTESIQTLMKTWNVPLEKICLLDPKAPLKLDVCDANKFPKPPVVDAAGEAEGSSAAQKRDGPFDYFLFGGILGDDPPRDRTASLRLMGFPGRHLGKIQMTTDTALGVTKRVVEDGLHLSLPEKELGEEGLRKQEAEEAGRGKGKLVFVEYPEIKFSGGESVEMPFRYMSENMKDQIPLMPPGMREHIRSDLDRAFEF